ncbi:ISL3 family transposase [Acidobacteriota bacterium]
MLIESLVRKTLGVKDHKVVSVRYVEDRVMISIDRKKLRKITCSCCEQRCWSYDTLKERQWKHVPIWGIPAIIRYRPRRVKCPLCGIKVERIPWGPTKSPLTIPLIIVLATWAKLLAMDVVAKLYGVSWSTVASAVKQAVDYGLRNRDTEEVFYLGIDEISRRKGHIYHTQVYDLSNNRLLWSGEGRSAETLEAFFRQWGPKRTARIRGICCDMWAPYIIVIQLNAPEAILVFDKFHLIRHLLQAVDKVRKEEIRRLKPEHPDLLKGTKYIWLKNPWNLTPKQKERLGFLEKLNLKINRAYLLKEAFQELWMYPNKGWARRFLKKWFLWATHSRLKPMRDFACPLCQHR